MDVFALQSQLRNNSTDLANFCDELKQWGAEMKRKEDSLKTGAESSPTDVPLPRNKVRKTTSESKIEPAKPKAVKRVPSTDYSKWDKFDVEAACAKVDEEKRDGDDSGDLSDEYDESSQDAAIYEKEKGNKFVKHQKWDEAIQCYTKAIECYGYDPVFYANRALCSLKKQNYRAADSDCTTALQLDKTYVKAYQRRAAAREALNQLSEAHADLLKVFDYESNNKESKAALAKLEKKLESFSKTTCTKAPEAQRPKTKFTVARQIHKKAINDALASTSSSVPFEPPEEAAKIATYWPSGNDVELVEAVFKPPHLRSKEPLKRIDILDSHEIKIKTPVGLNNQNNPHAQSWPRPDSQSKVIKCDELKIVERKMDSTKISKETNRELDQNQQNVQAMAGEPKKGSKFSKERSNHKIICDTGETITNKTHNTTPQTDDFNFSIPETSVEFNYDWRLIKDKSDLRHRYLKQVNPKKFNSIFKESLDCDVFSGIIHTLSETFIKKNLPVYEYLSELCKVKRFSMLAMFMSEDDKKDMLKLVDYMQTENSLSRSDIDNLLRKYEL